MKGEGLTMKSLVKLPIIVIVLAFQHIIFDVGQGIMDQQWLPATHIRSSSR
jgi:hypothetical protein